MSPLRLAILEYLTLRRSLGFKLRLAGRGLIDFATFMEERDADVVTTKLALEWAQRPSSAKPETWAQRLGFVREFARYRIASDSRTEIPEWGLLPFGKKRARPYLFTEQEVKDLLQAALELPVHGHPGFLKRQTYYCLLGLLAVTGMRISEALGLMTSDVDMDAGVLLVRGSKFGQSRYVPLHPSVLPVLRSYLRFRNKYLKTHGRLSDYFFTKYGGGQIDQSDVNRTFHKLCRMIDLNGGKLGPRIHDLRHRFAIETLLCWYRNGEKIEQKLPQLSTYLGHVKVKDTYWYLTACPELMGEAARLLENRWEDSL
ncbi:MAG: integrase [Candidatus Melainabacteria bacterium]|nr:MAG: integrase [Candidatus Melainabacteria bacterium]